MNLAYYKKEYARRKRLIIVPHSERTFMKMMGRFWLGRYGFKREVRVYYGRGKHQFWSLDLAIPSRKLYIEVDSRQWHPKGNRHDIVRDFDLRRRGWIGLRVTTDDMRSPAATRRYVRAFVKDPDAFFKRYG